MARSASNGNLPVNGEAWRKFEIDMILHSIETGFFKLDGGAMFGVVPKSLWNKIHPADENNLCSWALRCLLIEDGQQLVLIDTGMGDKQDAKFFGHYYLHGDENLDRSLKKLGFDRADITDVILTHLHFDHCGGAIVKQNEKLVPAFQNARYHSNAAHWDWAVHPNEREKASFLKENILPIAESGKLNMVDQIPSLTHSLDDNGKLWVVPSGIHPEICFKIVNGHTRAMMLPQINYKGRTIVYMADLLPSVGHLPLPYIMAYDMHPLISLEEKKSFLQEALDENYLLFFEHDPVYECCNLQASGRGIRAKEFFKIGDL